MTVELTQQNFDAEFTNAQKDQVVLVDFGAEWCGPCRTMDKLLHDFEAANAGTVKVLKVNIEKEEGLSAQFAIRSIPTLIAYKNGQEIEKKVGGQNSKSIAELYQKALKA